MFKTNGREVPRPLLQRAGACPCEIWGGKSQQGLACHPPFQNGVTGAVFARYTVTLGAQDRRLEAEVGKKVGIYLIADPGANTYGDGGGWSNLRFSK